MGERKVINKYYPPDFNPEKLPRVRRSKNQPMKVRMMLPMSIRCNTCGNFIYKGTKFNMRKEVANETYLGLKIYRFYFKCSKCSAELIMKTDPKNSDYVVEAGATRNFEPWRDEDDESKEMGEDAMKSLEKRTLDSKRKIEIDAGLDELKSLKSRQVIVGVDAALAALQRNSDANKETRMEEEEEDEAVIRSVFPKPKENVRRIDDDDLDDDMMTVLLRCPKFKKPKASIFDSPSSRGNRSGSADGKIIFKHPTVRFSVVKKSHELQKLQDGEDKPNGASKVLKLLCQYDSDGDD